MEIRKFQKSTRQLIPQAPFNRLCKEIIQEIAPNREHRIQSEAITALQEVNTK
jgi:histone H3/H4